MLDMVGFESGSCALFSSCEKRSCEGMMLGLSCTLSVGQGLM